jgi:hypothetical protein
MWVWVQVMFLEILVRNPHGPHPCDWFGRFLRLSFKILTAFVQKVTHANKASTTIDNNN